MKRLPLQLSGLALLAGLIMGHVGSPLVIHQTQAGPYRLTVIVAPPAVAPGKAEVQVTVEGGPVEGVELVPYRMDLGPGGAPRGDRATPESDMPGTYHAAVWLMSATPHAIEVRVWGPPGWGQTVVPVTPVLVTGAQLPWWLGLILLSAFIFLFVSAVQIAGAGSLQGSLAAGEMPDPARHRVARMVRRRTALIAGTLMGAWACWWAVFHLRYQRRLYQPPALEARLAPGPEGNRLLLTVESESARGRAWRNLVPDHGHLMHLIAIGEPDLSSLAHLHPVALSGTEFAVTLPPLPSGSYRLYGDVVHADGFSETLTGRVELPTPVIKAGQPAAAATDDAWWRATLELSGDRAAVPEGFLVRSPSGQLRVGQPVSLQFDLRDSTGSLLSVEQYLGMPGHALVVRREGGVFIHLHSSGTVSAATLALLEPDTHRGHGLTQAEQLPGSLSFPYVFPASGSYRVWIQFRRGGVVETTAFDLKVEDSIR